MNLSHKSDTFSQYCNLEKHLDEQHKRLLQERQLMLSKQSQRLELYQKIDLVEFFDYKPTDKSEQESKKQMMYHLTAKFQNYMRKLTENNVYKKMGNLVNTNQEINQRERSASSRSKQRSNVQKNSDLGRMFQTMRFYENRYSKNQKNSSQVKNPNHNDLNQSRKSKTLLRSEYRSRTDRQNQQGINDLPYHVQMCLFNEKVGQNPQGLNLNIRSNKNCRKNILQDERSQKQAYKETSSSKKEKEVSKGEKQQQKQLSLMSIQQLSHTLDQQQKIYLLTELNYYIKLYKESQTKKSFMQRHLQNLHQFLVDVRHKYEAKGKSKGKPQLDLKSQNNILVEENSLLKKELQTYKRQIRALNRINNEEFFDDQQENKFLNEKSQQKCQLIGQKRNIEVKKIDRFKQFAQHIGLMQKQLSSLVEKVNATTQLEQKKQSPINQYPSYAKNLQRKIQQLQIYIARENEKKDMFFQQVYKFKEMMKSKDQQIMGLNAQIRRLSSIIQMQKTKQRQQHILGTSIVSNANRLNYEEGISDFYGRKSSRSKSKTRYTNSSSKKIIRLQRQNPLIYDRNDQFDRFIDSGLKADNCNGDNDLTQISQKENDFRYSRITTRQPSESNTGLRKSEIQEINRISNYEQGYVPQVVNPNDFITRNKENRSYTGDYHSRFIDPIISKNGTLPQRQRSSSNRVSRSRYDTKDHRQNSSRSRSRTSRFTYMNQCHQQYEPRPYERYNNTNFIASDQPLDSNLLYQRI